jgi:hypothetical protein
MGVRFINRYKSSLIWIVIILLLFWYIGIRPEIRISELKKNGKQVTGYLYEVKGVGSKGTIRGFYKFRVNDNLYEGFYDNDELVKYDSIEIIYLPENPELNQAKQFVEDYD